ncbi:MAG: helix-turn-helix domain-containing protein [Actinophytocola sp.]|uniref:helix-turn-helix domain-containing protein n=1 Tax=Actinophytocola sp. TaxID=1872138 RepID=UPI003D6B42FB
MYDHEPTVRSRELGLALLRAIGTAGLNQSDLAELLAWSPSKVSRMISGKRCASPEDVSAVLAVGRIVGPKRQELLEMARHATERGWWQEFGDRLPAELRTLSDHEDSALAITNFETVVIPGLLQTSEYAQALITASPVIPESETGDRVLARHRRQRIVDRQYPAQFCFFIDEYSIRRTGAGRKIMSDQVHQLLRMSVRPYIEIRVILDSVGFHAAHKPFQLMEFTEINPVLFIENDTSALFLERKDTIAAYRRTIAALSKVALDEDQSRSWLATLASELGEEHHAQRPAPIFELEEEFME